jgi:predicted Zn-dependent protease
MSQSRIDAFTTMLKDQPDNEMIWYGLANEFTKLEKWAEAVDAFRNVIRIKPDYTAAYQMLGSALMNLGQHNEARRAWTEGIEIAGRTGAWKARQHMEGQLAQMLAGAEGGAEGGFCKD